MTTNRTWVVVLSQRHALQAAATHRITTGTGKRAVLTRMSTGDHIVVYSPRTDHPGGEPFRAVTVVGTITGAQPEGDEASGFGLAAELRRIEPVRSSGSASICPCRCCGSAPSLWARRPVPRSGAWSGGLSLRATPAELPAHGRGHGLDYLAAATGCYSFVAGRKRPVRPVKAP